MFLGRILKAAYSGKLSTALDLMQYTIKNDRTTKDKCQVGHQEA